MSLSITIISDYETPDETLPNGVKVYNPVGTRKDYPGGCFGFVNGELYLGDSHHALIIYNLIEEGKYDWESLVNAKQKWGWYRVDRWKDGQPGNKGPEKLVISLTSDEASQSSDVAYGKLLLQSFSEYFNCDADWDPHVGAEGYSNARQYGERSKEQYWGEPSRYEYCQECDEEYDPETEGENHIHEAYCEGCGNYYDPQNEWESDEHSQPYCENCGLHVTPDHNFEHLPPSGTPPVGSQVAWKGQKFYVKDVDPDGMRLTQDLGGNTWTNYISWRDWFKEMQPQNTAKWQEFEPKQSSFVAIAHNADLMDEQVFAKLSMDYIKMGADYYDDGGGLMDYDDFVTQYNRNNGLPPPNRKPQVDESGFYRQRDFDPHHQTIDGQPATDYYDKNWSNLSLEESDTDTHFAIKDPDSGETLGYLPKDRYHQVSPTPKEPAVTQPTTTPTGQQPDNPKLLDIVRDPKTIEYRWSYDGKQLHIWRVFSRTSYGPSHYDMFGNDGYENHSQGRVYISPQSEVGVLYWQISHPECEQVLNEWVQKELGKMPDFVYRAYGPYAGEVRPRWYFPIVEVSGLPIRQNERWWENGEKSPSWYKEVGISKPKVKTKGYPGKKIYELPAGDVNPEDYATPSKGRGKKNRRRRRNKQYRNRNFRGR